MIYGNIEIIMTTEQNSHGKLYYRVYARNKSSKALCKDSNFLTKFRLLAFRRFKKLLKKYRTGY